ncbi:MAG: XdhC family protein [Verrucomicrobia bacterium]|nr:XdhC family protein [Verrucomicrobiota bacterium]
MKETQAIVTRLLNQPALPAVLATLVATRGSSYRRPGARLLVEADGQRTGAISGGCLEEDLLVRARRVRTTGEAEKAVYDTTAEEDLVWGVGLGCHGVVEVLLEPILSLPDWVPPLAANLDRYLPTRLAVRHGGSEPRTWGTRLAGESSTTGDPHDFVQEVSPSVHLAVFGAGEDAISLVRLAAMMGWRVTVADPRPALVTVSRFPDATARFSGPAEQLVRLVDPDPAASAVIMTHHYVHDLPLLRELLARPLSYLGLLGPRRRAEKLLGDLAAAGQPISSEQRVRLHAPVGLDLGAEAPEQVALAIVAEVQAVKTGRDARPLRMRTLPIHQAPAPGPTLPANSH